MMRRVVPTWMLPVTLIIGGCFGSDSSNDASAAARAPSGNKPPQISGAPTQTVLQNTQYAFMPAATDADRDKLTFSITHKPGWATFNRATGKLSGVPRGRHVGTYSGIKISVSDGRTTSSLPTFGITVTQSGSGSVTLSWLPPTSNDDGTTFRDLAGYRIYVGQSASSLNRIIVLDNSGLTRYVVEDLTAARWHFAMTSVNARGRESRRSPTVSKVVG